MRQCLGAYQLCCTCCSRPFHQSKTHSAKKWLLKSRRHHFFTIDCIMTFSRKVSWTILVSRYKNKTGNKGTKGVSNKTKTGTRIIHAVHRNLNWNFNAIYAVLLNSEYMQYTLYNACPSFMNPMNRITMALNCYLGAALFKWSVDFKHSVGIYS